MLRHSMLLLLFVCAPVSAQPKPSPGDEMIQKYLNAEADKLSQKFLGGAKTLEEWQQKRPRLYREYMDMLGLWPIPEKTSLKATVTGQVEAHGVIVEKLHYQSKPGLYVTANLYKPRTLNGKRAPAILYVCGHTNRGRDGNKTAFQDHGFWFASNGYICLMVDTLQLGEIPGVHHGTYGLNAYHYKKWGLTPKEEPNPRWWWHSLGYSPAAVECWNGVRGIDYLVSRPDVDPEKIGVTGISGGGAATFWIAAADDRVKVAVPVSGMSDLESYVKNKVINGHCDCMFLYNTYQWDWTTIAALVAPRPLLFANSDNDKIFPMDGNRRIIDKLRKLYKMYDKPGLVDDYVSVGGHDYRPDLRIAIFKFINTHLKGDAKSPVEDSAKYTELPGKELRVFPTDDDLPKDVLNGKIDELFIRRAKVTLPEEGKFAEWKKEMISKLRRQCFKMPKDVLEEKQLHLAISKHQGGTAYVALFLMDIGKFESLQLRQEKETVTEKAQKFFSSFLTEEEKSWTVTLSRAGKLPESEPGVLARTTHEWNKKSPPNYVERSHALLGLTVDELKAYRLLGTIECHNEQIGGGGDVKKIIGFGKEGIIAAYAALLRPGTVSEVVVIDPPKSHMEGPHFLNVLRVLDIPEALGLLAPTPLTIIGGKDAAFDRTAEIYRLAGAADKLTRK